MIVIIQSHKANIYFTSINTCIFSGSRKEGDILYDSMQLTKVMQLAANGAKVVLLLQTANISLCFGTRNLFFTTI